MPRLAGMRQPRSSLSSSPLIESSNIVRILRKLSDWSSKAPPRHGSAGITCSSATACNGLWDKVLRACGCLSTPGIAARGSTCVCLLVPQPGRGPAAACGCAWLDPMWLLSIFLDFNADPSTVSLPSYSNLCMCLASETPKRLMKRLSPLSDYANAPVERHFGPA